MEYNLLFRQRVYDFSVWLGGVLAFLPPNITSHAAYEIYEGFILEEENLRNEEQKAIRKFSR
jgi:hypothetical protein